MGAHEILIDERITDLASKLKMKTFDPFLAQKSCQKWAIVSHLVTHLVF